MNLPNTLSISRVLLLIPIILLFEYDLYLFSLLIFVVASISDYLDGYLARKNNQTSNLGALLDLLADKIFVSTLLIWMNYNFADPIILISSIFIVAREISISALRLYIISRSGQMEKIKSDLFGKYKTAFQMIGLGFILVSPLTPDYIFNFGLILVLFSALISWYSFVRYLNKWIV